MDYVVKVLGFYWTLIIKTCDFSSSVLLNKGLKRSFMSKDEIYYLLNEHPVDHCIRTQVLALSQQI